MLNSTNMAFLTKSLSQFISSGIQYKSEAVPSPYILSTSPPDSSMELYVLEHRLQVCFIPKTAITEFCHSLIKISLLCGARLVFFLMFLFVCNVIRLVSPTQQIFFILFVLGKFQGSN